jgi:signal transduction histidine kinase
VLTGAEADVRLEVTNRGPAIEPSALAQIFDPLKRGSDLGGSRNADDGLGLGLYIVREVTRAHGGQVGVSSDGGETVFTVRLPRRHEGAST